MGIALARFGMLPQEFYDLAPIEFSYAVQYQNETEYNKGKLQYEVARYTAFFILNSAGKSLKHNLNKLSDVGLFEWEKEGLGKITQTTEEMKVELLNIASSFKHLPPSQRKRGKRKEK